MNADVDKCMQLFSMRQKGQLDVFGLWGVLRGQLLTDDSFVYNRVLGRIKDSIQHLPEATEDDEEALLRVKVAILGWQRLALTTWDNASCAGFCLIKCMRMDRSSPKMSHSLSVGSAGVCCMRSPVLD